MIEMVLAYIVPRTITDRSTKPPSFPPSVQYPWVSTGRTSRRFEAPTWVRQGSEVMVQEGAHTVAAGPAADADERLYYSDRDGYWLAEVGVTKHMILSCCG